MGLCHTDTWLSQRNSAGFSIVVAAWSMISTLFAHHCHFSQTLWVACASLKMPLILSELSYPSYPASGHHSCRLTSGVCMTLPPDRFPRAPEKHNITQQLVTISCPRGFRLLKLPQLDHGQNRPSAISCHEWHLEYHSFKDTFINSSCFRVIKDIFP